MQSHSLTSLETARSLANGPSWGGGVAELEVCFLRSPGIPASPISISFVYGRSLWAELNGGENSLHWKVNMLPLFSIMTLCMHQLLNSSLSEELWVHQMNVSLIRLLAYKSRIWKTTAEGFSLTGKVSVGQDLWPGTSKQRRFFFASFYTCLLISRGVTLHFSPSRLAF